MRSILAFALAMALFGGNVTAGDSPTVKLPKVADGWSIELVAKAPGLLYPTAIVAAPNGDVFIGSDPMDMVGPPTEPIDCVLVVRNGKIETFADKLHSVMGLEFIDGTLYVVHAPFLSALRDRDGDGRADERVDLVTGLGPKVPGFNGINDHIASGLRLGMDGFLYIAVGDKGIPNGVGRDGAKIQLAGGGVIRIRPDGTGLEVVSTGECNPLSVALTASDEIFTFGNDDDSKRWPNSLTHHIVGADFGYPYQFLSAPRRVLPIVAGETGGVGTQGFCYNDDGLPPAYRGNLFFCDWGRQTVDRFEMSRAGGTFRLRRRTQLVTRGEVADFRPFAIAPGADGASLWLTDWGYTGWLASNVKSGRLYRLRYAGADRVVAAPRPKGADIGTLLNALDHPAMSVRLSAQRALAEMNDRAVPALVERLQKAEPEIGRPHALWALDAIGGPAARTAIAAAISDRAPAVRIQAVRSVGIHGDATEGSRLIPLLNDRDPAIRRETAIALSRLDVPAAAPALYAALGDADLFTAWSVRQTIRRKRLWDQALLTAAFGDDRRLEAALRLTDEAWAAPAVQALIEFLKVSTSPAIRERVVANLAGQYLKYPDWTGDWFGTNPLGGEFPQKTREWDQAGMRGVLSGLAIGLDDGDRGVRAQAIAGLARAGTSKEALVLLRSALLKEPDAENQAEIAATLGQREDVSAAPSLVALFSNPARPESVRMAALEATARFRDPQSLRARLELIYDSNTPEKLAARGLHDLATRGFLPINDLASFIENPSPAIRAAAILSFNVKRTLPDYLEAAVVDRIGDPAAEVRQAAIIAAAPLKLKAAIPRLLTIASDSHAPERALAIRSLCALPDPRAAAVYLAEIESTDPARRRAAEFALSEIRDQVQPALEQASKTAAFASGPGADALERVRARFEPIGDWKVIGPFPRATPPLFVGQPRIDFAQTHAGALGQTIGWRPRSPEGSDGRISLGDLAGLGFGYDAKHSPELSAFAYTEVAVETPAHALLRADSTGRIYVMVNEAPVFQAQGSPTKIPATFDSDPVRIELNRGTNRILVVSRQGVGEWGFRLQIARLDRRPILAKRPGPSAAERLAKYAMEHTGDPARGRRVFFESEAAGCARCHSASGQGKANIGPDLTGLASKYDRAELIRSVLEPSSRIATGYVPVIIATHAGAVVTGVVRRENDRVIELADSEGAIRRISRAQVAARRPATTSIMPSGLAETLRPEDFADLIAFLASLRHDRDAAAAQASATGP